MIQEKIVFVEGMTCSACEARIEKALRSLDGVLFAKARLRGGRVEIRYDEGRIAPEAFGAAIERAGYTLRARKGAGTAVALGIGIVLAAGYMFASAAGLFNAFPTADVSLSLGMLFVIGLLTSVHCTAMCGGIAISASLPPEAATKALPLPRREGMDLARLRPGILYNLGRVVSYTIVGGLVGGIGSVFSFSSVAKGALTAAAGLFMLLLGLKMLGLIPRLPRASGLLPAALRRRLGAASTALGRRGTLAVGLLNGLMPCGPLQTMQLYALGTGSALAGALSMLVFSAGTVPLLLAFGLAATMLPRRFLPAMLKASAVLVMVLGVATFARAAALAGVALPQLPSLASSGGRVSAALADTALAGAGAVPLGAAGAIPAGAIPAGAASADGPAIARIRNGVQTVTTVFDANDYAPFVVQAGVPVRWTIRIAEKDLTSCNSTLIVPGYGIQKTLQAGDNLVEFTPKAAGVVPYSCWMGMIRSRITVVPDLASYGPPPSASTAQESAQGGAQGTSQADSQSGSQPGSQSGAQAGSLGDRLSGLLGQGGGSSLAGVSGGPVPVDVIGMPVVHDGVQEITIKVTAAGYSPAAIVLQKGMKAIIRFEPDQLTSCNSRVVFPTYNGSLDLARGQLATPPIMVTGDFPFDCWMGMLHGYVKAVDSLSKVNLAQVKREIGSYRPAGGSCCSG